MPLAAAAISTALASMSYAQDPAKPAPTDPSSSQSTAKSGFQIPTLEGPNGVARELVEQDAVGEYRFEILHRALAPWFDWKRRMHERFGLSLGLNIAVDGQCGWAGDDAEDFAGGGIYRFQGAWTAVGRGSGHPGSLNVRLEYRSSIGGLGPSALSNRLGIAAPNTGFGYSNDLGPDAAVLNWTQLVAGERVGLVFGRLDFAAYLDPYPYQSFAKGFLNRAFVLNPSTATTGVGAMGFGGKGFANDDFWVGAFAYDANAVSGEFNSGGMRLDELFKHIELGWTPGYDRRKSDKILLTYWEVDERVEAGKPAGRGWLLTAHGLVAERYMLFLRAGRSDGGGGAAAEDAVSVGVGISTVYDDELSIGLGWSRPSEKTFGPGSRDETAFEVSYRFQMSPNATLMPDFQLVLNPANNPDADRVWVVSLRVRWDI